MAGGGFGIPEAIRLDEPYSEEQAWTGWSATVPGYLRGLESAHSAFGKLNWEDLWEPAIAFAEEGFKIDHFLWVIPIIQEKCWVVSKAVEGRIGLIMGI